MSFDLQLAEDDQSKFVIKLSNKKHEKCEIKFFSIFKNTSIGKVMKYGN